MFEILEFEDAKYTPHTLRSMFQLRYKLFIEDAGWDVPCNHTAKEEIDQFDVAGTQYIVRTNFKGDVVACVRMLRTDRPNLLRDEFSTLIDGPLPSSKAKWEASRLAIEHREEKLVGIDKDVDLCGELYCAIQEFALQENAKNIVSVSDRAMEIHLKKGGWLPTRLGQGINRADSKYTIYGLSFPVSINQLTRLQKRANVSSAVLINQNFELQKIVA